MTDDQTPEPHDDEFDPDAFFEKFGEAQLDREQVDLDRLEELTKLAVAVASAAGPDRRDAEVPVAFLRTEAKGEEFELHLVLLESGIPRSGEMTDDISSEAHP